MKRVAWYRSLRYMFPVGVMFVALLIIIGSYSISKSTIKSEVEKVVQENVRHRLNLLQGAIGLYIQLDRNEVYQQLISSIISEPDFIKLMIVDKDGKVINSSNSSDKGKLWVDVIHPVDEGKLEQVLLRRGTELSIDNRKDILEGYSALCVSEQHLRTKDCGFILYRADLNYHYQQSLAILTKKLMFNAIGIVFFGLLLIVLIQSRFTSRIQSIVFAMREFARGDYERRVPFSGKDELAFLGKDINELFEQVKSDRERIIASEKKLDAIFNTVLEGIVTINENGIIQTCNNSVTRMFGYEREELVGQNVKILMPDDTSFEHDGYIHNYKQTGLSKIIGKGRDVIAQHKDGKTFPVALSIAETKLNDTRLFTGVLHDISERKHLEGALVKANELLFKSNLQLKDNARTDALTGVANRRQFDYILQEELNRAARQQLPISLIMCDVDFFKLYNDTYGHQMGDECLSRIGTLLRQNFKRSGEMPARYGGEEFAVILPNVEAETARQQAEQFLARVRELSIEHKASKLREGIVTMSLGICGLIPDQQAMDAKALIRLADEALYAAKARGRNNVVVYGDEVEEKGQG